MKPLQGAYFARTNPIEIDVDALELGGARIKLPHEKFGYDALSETFGLKELESVMRAERIFSVPFECQRQPKHKMEFFVRLQREGMMKIGQWPSLADLQLPDVKKYEKVLSAEKRGELIRATGLRAHGIGIGSFA